MSPTTPLDALRRLRERLPDGGRVYAPGCSGEALAFVDAFRADPSLADGLVFLGVWIPGVNRTDYAGLHPSARSELIFLSADFRESFEKGDIALRPLSYTQAYDWLSETPMDAALLHVSPPGADGLCSLGVSADFTPAVLARDDVIRIAHVNPLMPSPASAPKVPAETFDMVVEAERPLLTYEPAALSPVFGPVAENIAALINDGDALQFGLGNVQLAVLRALNGKRNLRIHSGMISDPVLEAVEAGVISDAEGAITTGVALGSRPLYDFAANDRRVRFAPVNHTHAIDTLRGIENFTAINSVIEVDLFGQANAEYIGGKQVSGTGGLVDFLRGAAAAPGGKPIVALAATARKGAVSRIVPKLEAPSVSIARADVGIVATEFGVADLRGASVEARADALIAVAHPDHRPGLQKAWARMRETL